MLSFVFFTSCEKDNVIEPEQLATSEDEITTLDIVEDAEDQADLAVEFRGGDGNGCPTITVTPDDKTFPRKVVIDFGERCEGKNGHIRKGKIVVNQTAPMYEKGAIRTLTYEGYFVDDAKVEGSRVTTNKGAGALTHEIDSKITFPDGKFITKKATHTVKQIEGADTPLIRLDDVFAITGSAEGINRNGIAYKAEITKPLIKRRSCPWIAKGEKVVTQGENTLTINFGNGDCDRFAKVTLPDGTTKQIKLHRWW
jgi:hypothetical protein